MDKLNCFVAALALSILPTATALGQDAPQFTTSEICHYLGSWASEAAMSRRDGMPLSDLLGIVHGNATNNKKVPRPVLGILVAEMERIAIAVYATYASPDDAYVTYRAACLKPASAR